jgi:ribosomal protein S18 acetylase RimI-like enzyme
MFTHPEARGKGIAKAIVKKAIEHGLKEAAKIHSTYVASIVVDADNLEARALYEKCGFVEIGREVMPGTTRLVILLKWVQGSGTGVFEATVV